MPLSTTSSDATISAVNHANLHNLANAAINKGAADTVRLASDAAISSITLANLTGMSFTVAAATAYAFDFWIPWLTATTTVGKSFAVTVPASPTLITYAVDHYGIVADGTAAVWHGVGTATADAVINTTGGAVISTTYLARLFGLLTTGATAGVLQLQHASETATSTTTKAGAVGWLRQLT